MGDFGPNKYTYDRYADISSDPRVQRERLWICLSEWTGEHFTQLPYCSREYTGEIYDHEPRYMLLRASDPLEEQEDLAHRSHYSGVEIEWMGEPEQVLIPAEMGEWIYGGTVFQIHRSHEKAFAQWESALRQSLKERSAARKADRARQNS